MNMSESKFHKQIKLHSVDYMLAKGYRVAKEEVIDWGFYGIYDAWGINPSNLYTLGIETKVSRTDWKAAVYKEITIEERSCANENYIACPSGLILPEEVGGAVGLLWYNERGRFVNKKKPTFIKVPIHKKIQTLLKIYEPFFKNW